MHEHRSQPCVQGRRYGRPVGLQIEEVYETRLVHAEESEVAAANARRPAVVRAQQRFFCSLDSWHQDLDPRSN